MKLFTVIEILTFLVVNLILFAYFAMLGLSNSAFSFKIAV